MIKSTIYFLLFQSFVACLFNVSASGIDRATQEKKVFHIVKQNVALLDSVNQLLVVFNEKADRNLATLVAMEKKVGQ